MGMAELLAVVSMPTGHDVEAVLQYQSNTHTSSILCVLSRESFCGSAQFTCGYFHAAVSTNPETSKAPRFDRSSACAARVSGTRTRTRSGPRPQSSSSTRVFQLLRQNALQTCVPVRKGTFEENSVQP